MYYPLFANNLVLKSQDMVLDEECMMSYCDCLASQHTSVKGVEG